MSAVISPKNPNYSLFYVLLLINSGMKAKRDDVGNYWPASSKRQEIMTKDSKALVMNIYKKNRRMDGE